MANNSLAIIFERINKMEENKKNARIFYLTLAVILTVVVVLVIATTVARRATPNPDGDEILSGGSGLTDDTQTGTEDTGDDILPTFTLPISDGNISMDFSDSVPVFSQTMNDYRTHLGVDIKSSLGDDVLAVADGVVTNIWDDPFMGKCISIEHSGNAVSIYKNLDPVIAEGLVIGASVKGGDVIASVGESAMNEIAEEPHLHFEMKINDKHVDPKEHFKFPMSQKPEENTQGNENNS